MAAERRVDSTADLRDLDASTRVAGRFLRHDGTKFVGDADVASAADLTALDAAIDNLAADLAAETSARQAADATLTTAVSGKQDHATTLDSLSAATYPAGKLLGGQGTGIPAAVTVGSGLSLSGGTLATSGSTLAIGATVTGGTGGSVLYLDASGFLSQNARLTFDGGTLKLRPGEINVSSLSFYDSSYALGIDDSDLVASIANSIFAAFEVKAGGVVSGTSLMRLTGAGYLGLGTAGPNKRLNIVCPTLDTAIRISAGAAGASQAIIFSDESNIDSGNVGYLAMALGTAHYGLDTMANDFVFASSKTGSRVHFATGLTGLNPTTKLLVANDGEVMVNPFGRADASAVLLSVTGSIAQSSPLIELRQRSSTFTARNAGNIDAIWTVSTDSSRLGELVLSSSGYNGDHVGLRVRDTGSAAQVILGGATAGRAIYLGSSGELIHSSGFLFDGTNLSVPGTGGGTSEHFGAGATATQVGASAFGQGANATGVNATALGQGASASMNNSVAVAVAASASATAASAFGVLASATGINATAIGQGANAAVVSGTALGTAASVTGGSGGTALGVLANVTGVNALAAGLSASATALNAVALGTSCSVSGIGSYGLGPSCSVSGNNSVGIGNTATVAHDNSFALGVLATTTATNQLMVGSTFATGQLNEFATISNTTFTRTIRVLSSTGVDRVAARYSASWSVNTDASRLGELVLSSSGYNGDHVGLRVRDTGSAAQVILEGATADSVLYLTSGGVLAQRNPGFTYDGSTLCLRDNGSAASQEWQSAGGGVHAVFKVGRLGIAVEDPSAQFHMYNRTAGTGGVILDGTESPGIQFYRAGVSGYGFFGLAFAAAGWGQDTQPNDLSFGTQRGGDLHLATHPAAGNPLTRAIVKNAGSVIVNPYANNGASVSPLVVAGSAAQSAPLLPLQQISSTGTRRDAGNVNAGWAVSTDASRLGELIFSSSGYNGNHVGLRVRDNGSGADLIADNMREAADDTAAAALSPPVPVNGLYRTGSTVKIRVS
jgi:hypothetical protein